MPLLNASSTVSFLYDVVAMSEPRNTITGIPIIVARSGATATPE